jgi:hypothetical protein
MNPRAGRSRPYSVTEGESMVFKTTGKRIEVEYERGGIFFVRLPLLGEVLWTHTFGWEYWSAREVKRQRAAGLV